MTQEERRLYLISSLLAEDARYRGIKIPTGEAEQRRLLRSLFNVRPPRPVSDEFLSVQDEYLRAVTASKGVTRSSGLAPVTDGIFLWQGDITTLACGAIVNAANSGLTGCYYPCHGCIDNAIHTYAGVRLRLACAEIMARQHHEEPVGQAKLTPAYDLPCEYVIHTVGPMIRGEVTERERDMLASCYRSCLSLAKENNIKSVAFPCISTGEFRFPNAEAAEIAVRTVKEHRGGVEVIFNVYKDADLEIYKNLLR